MIVKNKTSDLCIHLRTRVLCRCFAIIDTLPMRVMACICIGGARVVSLRAAVALRGYAATGARTASASASLSSGFASSLHYPRSKLSGHHQRSGQGYRRLGHQTHLHTTSSMHIIVSSTPSTSHFLFR
jgi:hypothetical protein